MGSVKVVKLGGSVLTDPAAYRRAAKFFRARLAASPQARFVAVVSAQGGHTDELQRTAERFMARPNPVMLDLLWSTGELRSVALLTLALHAAGVRAMGLNVEQAGLQHGPGPAGAGAVSVDARGVVRALERYRVVVAPGFLARRSSGGIVTLGRGGSDLSAVLLAEGLRADRCELIKDVPGYFSQDPRCHPDAQHIPALPSDVAMAMARAGCDLVQPQALEAAARCGVTLVIRSLKEGAPQTEVRPVAVCGGPAQCVGGVPAAPGEENSGARELAGQGLALSHR
jgi:aspartokinase